MAMSMMRAIPQTPTSDHRWRVGAIVGLSLPIFIWVARLAPLAQDPAYHAFADQRRLAGVAHFWNVISNLPFALVGLLGCIWLVRSGRKSGAFTEPVEQFAYFLFFAGEILTCLGSAYYHSAPSNETLVWDRLVFSLMLTSFWAIVVTEFIDLRVGTRILAPWVLLGVYSVLYWSWSESSGRGDLRLYLLVQFYPVIAIPLIVGLFRSRYPHSGALSLAWAMYVVAKLCELYDAPIYQLTGFWSGHTIKHLAAAGASYLLLDGLWRRSEIDR